VNPGALARAKLDPILVRAIRVNSEKRSFGSLAAQLKVCRSTVSRAARAVTWRWVEQ
jgi:hypothetical protein